MAARAISLCWQSINGSLGFGFLTVLALTVTAASSNAQTRSLGLDISAWQGNISQTTWNNIHNVENRDFVFVRASRGGTTGIDRRAGGFPAGNNTTYELSQRYDDLYFVQNITRATNAGMFAGAYHFGRMDIIESTPYANGIANSGADEADHFIQMAGPWMRPGYLLPVFDHEAGINERNANGLAQFAVDFSNRIYEVMGIRPAIYIGGNYANDLESASQSLQTQITDGYPTLWSARWPNQSNPDSIPVQTGHPKDTYSAIYGPWDDTGTTHPWSFWQYASTGRLQSFNNGGSNLDFDVARGGTEFLKDKLVPAIWMNDSDGDWSTLANWNSGADPVAPVPGPGQVARVGAMFLPTPRLPGQDDIARNVDGQNDTVILDRPHADITVTLSSGNHNIRKLYAREALNITGGSLTINYTPVTDSTPISAQFSAPVSLSGDASFSVHTLQVDAANNFTLAGGTVSANRINLMPDVSTPAKLLISGDVTFNPLDDASSSIVLGSGVGSPGFIDLDGEVRKLTVNDSSQTTDLTISVALTNGGFHKAGAGTLRLTGDNSYAGDTIVEEGTLRIYTSYLSDTADVYLSTGGILNLNIGAATDVIDSLFIDGVMQRAGIWGPEGSSAQFTSPLITGTGLLQVMTAPIAITGDFDGDGDVDGQDFLAWQRGLSPSPFSGEDLAVWQSAYSNASLPTAASTSVPEPTGLVLTGIVLVAFSFKRRSV